MTEMAAESVKVNATSTDLGASEPLPREVIQGTRTLTETSSQARKTPTSSQMGKSQGTPYQGRERRRPRSSSLQKYKRVEKPREQTPDDEIRVMGNGKVPRYVAYAGKLLTEQSLSGITICATGKAVAIAVSVCEVVKRRFKGLHQQTTIGWTLITDEYEPLESGLEPRVERRSVPCLSILLTTDESRVDKSSPGYQPPIDESQIVTDPEAFSNIGKRLSRRPAKLLPRNKSASKDPPANAKPQDPSVAKRRRRRMKRVGKTDVVENNGQANPARQA